MLSAGREFGRWLDHKGEASWGSTITKNEEEGTRTLLQFESTRRCSPPIRKQPPSPQHCQSLSLLPLSLQSWKPQLCKPHKLWHFVTASQRDYDSWPAALLGSHSEFCATVVYMMLQFYSVQTAIFLSLSEKGSFNLDIPPTTHHPFFSFKEIKCKLRNTCLSWKVGILQDLLSLTALPSWRNPRGNFLTPVGLSGMLKKSQFQTAKLRYFPGL